MKPNMQELVKVNPTVRSAYFTFKEECKHLTSATDFVFGWNLAKSYSLLESYRWWMSYTSDYKHLPSFLKGWFKGKRSE